MCIVLAAALVSSCRGQADSTGGDNAAGEQKKPVAKTPAAKKPPATLGQTPALIPKWDQSKPKAPSKDGLSTTVGTTSFEDMKALAAKTGLRCKDASPAAQVKQMKKKRAEKMAAAGKSPDAIASASWNRETAHERITQIRWSCPSTASTTLTDYQRAPSSGRVLFIFDSLQHAVRHVSFGRRHKSPKTALEDILTSTAAYEKRFGKPHIVKHDLPAQATDDFTLPAATNVLREWQFGDLRVKVEAFSLDGSNIRVYEMVEVPAGMTMKPLAGAAKAAVPQSGAAKAAVPQSGAKGAKTPTSTAPAPAQ